MTERPTSDYRTPIMADVETAYRRLLRFQLKVGLMLLGALVVVGGIVAVVAINRVNDTNAKKGRPVTVPNVVGLDTVQASRVLWDAKIKHTEVDKASDAVPMGHVIATNPPAGAKLARDSRLQVTRSCGRPNALFCNP